MAAGPSGAFAKARSAEGQALEARKKYLKEKIERIEAELIAFDKEFDEMIKGDISFDVELSYQKVRVAEFKRQVTIMKNLLRGTAFKRGILTKVELLKRELESFISKF